jgi:membrane protein implicated in regulation of membrane protease activity
MLEFTINRDRDPNRASLRRLLEAHVIYERTAAAKEFSLHLLAIVGVVIWVGAEWPAFLSPQLLDSALAIWVGLLFFAILASIEEWLWHRKVARYRDEHQAKQKQGAG